MQTRLYTVVIACMVVIGIVSGSVWKPLGHPALAQATNSSPHSPHRGQWIRLNDYSGRPPFPVWVNLERADSIRFFKGSFDTRQNVPQAVVTLGRDIIYVNDPHEIAVLRRYLQAQQLG